MKDTWEVTVKVGDEKIITISNGHMNGIGDASDYEDEIRECAKHLLGFIGELGQLNAAQHRVENDTPSAQVSGGENVSEENDQK